MKSQKQLMREEKDPEREIGRDTAAEVEAETEAGVETGKREEEIEVLRGDLTETRIEGKTEKMKTETGNPRRVVEMRCQLRKQTNSELLWVWLLSNKFIILCSTHIIVLC